MKNLWILILAAGLCFTLPAQIQDLFVAQNSEVQFFFETSPENIQASNKKISSLHIHFYGWIGRKNEHERFPFSEPTHGRTLQWELHGNRKILGYYLQREDSGNDRLHKRRYLYRHLLGHTHHAWRSQRAYHKRQFGGQGESVAFDLWLWCALGGVGKNRAFYSRKFFLIKARSPRCGCVGKTFSMTTFTLSKRLEAWRREIRPSTGMENRSVCCWRVTG